MARDTRSLQRYEDGALVGRITPEGPPVRRHADVIGAASRVVGLLLKLTLLAILLAALVGLLGVIGVGGRATATIGERIGGAFDHGVGAVAGAVQVPVIAIGGVTADRVAELVAVGAEGVAVVSAVSAAADPAAVTRGLLAALARGLASR